MIMKITRSEFRYDYFFLVWFVYWRWRRLIQYSSILNQFEKAFRFGEYSLFLRTWYRNPKGKHTPIVCKAQRIHRKWRTSCWIAWKYQYYINKQMGTLNVYLMAGRHRSHLMFGLSRINTQEACWRIGVKRRLHVVYQRVWIMDVLEDVGAIIKITRNKLSKEEKVRRIFSFWGYDNIIFSFYCLDFKP